MEPEWGHGEREGIQSWNGQRCRGRFPGKLGLPEMIREIRYDGSELLPLAAAAMGRAFMSLPQGDVEIRLPGGLHALLGN